MKQRQQEIFDIVSKHLLTQNTQSVFGGGALCAYRGSQGRKCAIGVLISDEDYKPEMEGMRVSAVLNEFSAVADKLKDVSTFLLGELQRIHDTKLSEQWPEELRAVATRYDLKVNF